MANYRKKPVVIDAIHYNGSEQSLHEVLGFCAPHEAYGQDGKVLIPTTEGTMAADKGDWVIRGVKGEVYPCKPDIFEATYERVGG
jgi:hypothetical protein